ncbi:MAG: hypothetical protein WDM79_13305 [Terricaulis sp.]
MCFALTAAGRARLRRAAAAPDESFVAQHEDITQRSVIDAEGALHDVRAVDGAGAIKRLSQLRAARGAPLACAGGNGGGVSAARGLGGGADRLGCAAPIGQRRRAAEAAEARATCMRS